MTKQLMLDFPLAEEDVTLTPGVNASKLSVELGNGVRLTTDVPLWVRAIRSASLQLTMEVEGSPPDANPEPTPIQQVHETPPDGGQQER